jgi:hypothetical protein
MKIVFKNQATQKKNSSMCSVTEYPLNDSMLDIAIATIAGRYPENGRVINRECKELAYVQRGEGKIVINGEHCQPAFITFDNDKTAKFYNISLREIVLLQGWDIARIA